jgi:hypothetical protein
MKPRPLNLFLAWLITLALSVAVAIWGYVLGRFVDCKPGQSDGQCGLSTFLGFYSGVLAGVAILLCVTVYLIVVYRRRPGNAKTTKERRKQVPTTIGNYGCR